MRKCHDRLAKTALACLLFLVALGCYHVRPDEIQPEQASAMWDKSFPKHPAFTQQNLLLLNQGMTTTEVESIFGLPDRTYFKAFFNEGGAPWRGLVYEYDMGYNPRGEYIRNLNSLVFSIEHFTTALIHWDIQLAYPARSSMR